MQELEERLQQKYLLLVQEIRSVHLEMMSPLAAALKRQDNLLLDRWEEVRQVRAMQHEQIEMLEEILNSLQPSVFQQLGLPSRPPSSPNSAG